MPRATPTRTAPIVPRTCQSFLPLIKFKLGISESASPRSMGIMFGCVVLWMASIGALCPSKTCIRPMWEFCGDYLSRMQPSRLRNTKNRSRHATPWTMNSWICLLTRLLRTKMATAPQSKRTTRNEKRAYA